MSHCGQQILISGRLLRTAQLAGDGYESIESPEAAIDHVRNGHDRADLFTFMQIMPDVVPKFSYAMEWDNLAVLSVSTFDYWWNHQIRSYPRNRARQAEKRGVELREAVFDDALVRGIWQVYNECPLRQGRRFRHYGISLEEVHRVEATFLDSSIFIGAYLDVQLIGFVKITWDQTRTQANLMNIVSMVQHKDKAPTNALIAQAVRSCAERNIRYLAYQSFSYGKRGEDSMSNFKAVNGFERVEIPRYYVPLSARGALALRLGLHHRLADQIPQFLSSGLRAARKAWYEHKAGLTT